MSETYRNVSQQNGKSLLILENVGLESSAAAQNISFFRETILDLADFCQIPNHPKYLWNKTF